MSAAARTLICAVLVASTASAAPTDPPSEPDSYRLQTFAVSVTGALLLGGSLLVHDHDTGPVHTMVSGPIPRTHDRENVFGLGLATYLLAAPILHVVHHRVGTAFESLALRVGLPLGSAFVGVLATGGSSDEGFIVGAVVGSIAGTVAASAIDVGYLSAGERAVSVSPSVGVSRTAMTFGLAGQF